MKCEIRFWIFMMLRVTKDAYAWFKMGPRREGFVTSKAALIAFASNTDAQTSFARMDRVVSEKDEGAWERREGVIEQFRVHTLVALPIRGDEHLKADDFLIVVYWFRIITLRLIFVWFVLLGGYSHEKLQTNFFNVVEVILSTGLVGGPFPRRCFSFIYTFMYMWADIIMLLSASFDLLKRMSQTRLAVLEVLPCVLKKK